MKKKVSLIFTSAFLFRFFLAFLVWHPDVNNHVDWGIRFWEYGPAKFYTANVWSFTWPNQPPGSIYLYAGIQKLSTLIFSFFWWMNITFPLFPSKIMFFLETNLFPGLLQLPAILSDLGIAYLIYLIFRRQKKEKIGLVGAGLFLFNPAIWYNSAVWGQTDALVNFFALLSFVFLLERRLLYAVSAFLLSIYIKISLIIFIPVFLVVLIQQRYSWKDVLVSIAIPVVVLGLVTLPFSRSEPYTWLIRFYQDKVLSQQLQLITANAFNIWSGLTGIHEQSHTLLLGPLSYKLWGYILFSISILPALYLVYRRQDYLSIFWSLSIVSLSAFMLLTNMHERYLYPLFPVFTILVAQNKKLLPIYLSISGVYVINLYNFWWFPRVELFIDLLSAKDRLAPRILGFVNFAFFIFLYRRFLRHFRVSKL